jgi:predicted ABC-type transport system involved in lysophospholipase L1 biosynthesis ATPase subunit
MRDAVHAQSDARTERGPGVAPRNVDYAVALRDVRKIYGCNGSAVRALDTVDLDVFRGTFTAVMGPSGSGKSALLHCAAGLDRPTSGTVWLADTELGQLSESQLTKLRRTHIGFGTRGIRSAVLSAHGEGLGQARL